MNNEFIIEIQKKIDEMIRNNKFVGKFIVIFGANTPGDKIVNYLVQKGIQVDAVIDNNIMNKGKKLLGVDIYTPDEVLKSYKENLIVLISSKYYSEMCSQLQRKGYIENKHIIKLLELSDVNYSTDMLEFERAVTDIYEGIDVYNRIIEKYSEFNTRIFLCPVKANGDIYLIGSYIKEHLKYNNISKYVLVVIGITSFKVAKLFDIDNVEVIEQKEMEQIVKAQKFLGESAIKAKTLQPYYLYTSILNNLDGYKKINFGDFFKYCLFELEDRIESMVPSKICKKEQLDSIARDNELEKGKTVIIAPYANSLPGLPLEFWIKLSNKLLERRYKVYTNSIGNSETIVPKTKPINFSLDNAISVMEYAGYFVGIRSGICEIVSSAKCKKVILYPDKAYAFGKAIDIYGIKNIGISNDVLEMEINMNNSDSIINTILNYLDAGGD